MYNFLKFTLAWTSSFNLIILIWHLFSVTPANDAQEPQQQQQQQQQPPQISTQSTPPQQQQQHTQRTSNKINGGNLVSSTTTSKVFIKKSASSSSNGGANSQRKDSFGSRDSLNDILSETGLPTGNVAAQRKSLENKNLDLSKKQLPTTDIAKNSNLSTTNELRKSLENMDEKTKTTPPPVLTKKPTVSTKKANSVTSVAGNILSGLKQRVKGVESKLSTAVSSDAADGVGSSRMSNSPSGLPEAAPGGQMVMRRAATIATGGDDAEFDNVERASILTDMRAGRVRAPKRRPPSTATSSNASENNSIYLNGSGLHAANSDVSSDLEHKIQHSSDDNSTGEEQLAKPKPREWEKKKAPWMEELKASQVRKKVSPNIDRTSKLLEIAESSSISLNNTKVQSSSISSSSLMQQSMIHMESKKDETVAMSRSMITTTATSTTIPATTTTTPATTTSISTTTTTTNATATATSAAANVDDVRARPNSLSIKHRSISPALKSANTANNANEAIILNNNSKSAPSTVIVTNNSTHHHHHHAEPIVESMNNKNDESDYNNQRVLDLERRVDKLENVVQTQQRTIEELVRALREENDRVKTLRGELDKYAQCVTQV